MREKVIINEVGLRDGLQNQPVIVDTATKQRMFDALVRAGVRHFEPVSFVHPKAVPAMADAAELTARLPLADPALHLAALIPNLKGYERARDSGYRTVALVLSTTDTFNQRNLNMSLAQAVQSCIDILAQAKKDGVATRTYISGAFACPYDGTTPVAVTHELTYRMIDAGSDEIAIADTIGAGNPRQMQAIMRPLIAQYGAGRFFVHLHDTRGLATALAWTAADLGIRKFDASIGGLGGCPFAPGATGNVATEDLVYLLESCGLDTGIDLPGLREAVSIASRATGKPQGGRILSWLRSQELRARKQQEPCTQ
jgi:hydroxymethylglutaryl-CoA lyase